MVTELGGRVSAVDLGGGSSGALGAAEVNANLVGCELRGFNLSRLLDLMHDKLITELDDISHFALDVLQHKQQLSKLRLTENSYQTPLYASCARKKHRKCSLTLCDFSFLSYNVNLVQVNGGAATDAVSTIQTSGGTATVAVAQAADPPAAADGAFHPTTPTGTGGSGGPQI
uniref:Uncharacterized protein n=1 Tax=Oryza brachyantha TaxID=4533 RepID=J3LEE4_ORYBR